MPESAQTQVQSQEVLVLYYSPGGTTAEMANIIARGVEEIDGVQARIRTVAHVSPATEQTETGIPEDGPLYATVDDLAECDGLILGCPTHFGNMPAAMKYFIDGTSALWMGGKLAGKPAAVFSARTKTGGTPYGATRLTDDLEATPLSDDERKLCLALGRRVANTAKKLSA
jgi:NAD(P)H dehydrogenase (quinone)